MERSQFQTLATIVVGVTTLYWAFGTPRDPTTLGILALGLLGLFYTFASHATHVQYAPDWTLLNLNFPHSYHVTIGVVLLLITYSLRKNMKLK